MKVRCINDGWGYGLSIEIGDTFDITKDTMNFYYIGEKMYPKWMFEEVKEDEMQINFKFGLVNTIVINGIEYISWYDIPLSVRNEIPTYLYQPIYQFLTDNPANITKENK